MDQGDIINPTIFDELLKSSRKATKEDVQLADALEALIKHPSWGPYANQVLGARIQNLGELILQPAGSTSGAWKTEFLKGALYGLCLARDMPSVIVASMRDVRQPQESPDVPT